MRQRQEIIIFLLREEGVLYRYAQDPFEANKDEATV